MKPDGPGVRGAPEAGIYSWIGGLKSMRYRFLSVVLVVILAGCATTERFEREMDSYLGWDIAQLREHFGYNYIEHDLGDGTHSYTWVWSDRSLSPGYLSPDVVHTYQSPEGATRMIVSPGTYFPPSYYEFLCEFTFILDSSGHAVRWRAQGDGCAAYSGPESVLGHGKPSPPPSK